MLQERRRFLVPRLPALDTVPLIIMQGYLLNDDGFVVRVRRMSAPVAGGAEFGSVTIKGPRSLTGARVTEDFTFDDATLAGQVLRRCRWKVLKRRYQIDDFVALDVFEWDNAGLSIAEARVQDDESSPVDTSGHGWLGRDISGEPAFNNEWLARRPWGSWSAAERAMWAE